MSDTPAVKIVPAVVTSGASRGQEIVGAIAVEMTPLAQAVVRAVRTYIMGVLGFLTTLLTGKPVLESIGVMIPAMDFWSLFGTAAGLAVAPTVISFLWNFVEILGRIDSRFPKARA